MAFSASFTVKDVPSCYRGEKAKCCLMIVLKKLAAPIITKFLKCMTEGKMDQETLNVYVLRMRWMTSEKFESIFSEDHEIKTIRKYTDFHYFDLTLKFKCIREFMKCSPELVHNESLKRRILTQMDQIKHIRNDKLGHNRETLTETQWYETARSLKAPLVDLLKIIKNKWDRSINIPSEESNIATSIDEIMKGPINYEDFTYMCLQIGMNFVAEPVLNQMTKLLSFDRKEDNYKDYILDTRNGISKRVYKDTFFAKEQKLLQQKSSEIKPDVTLHSKMAILFKERHCKLKSQPEEKEELSIIIGNIRGIRNYTSHNMLAMPPEECRRQAQNLVIRLRELGIFAQRNNLYDGLDDPKIDVDKITSDINAIMSLAHS